MEAETKMVEICFAHGRFIGSSNSWEDLEKTNEVLEISLRENIAFRFTKTHCDSCVESKS